MQMNDQKKTKPMKCESETAEKENLYLVPDIYAGSLAWTCVRDPAYMPGTRQSTSQKTVELKIGAIFKEYISNHPQKRGQEPTLTALVGERH